AAYAAVFMELRGRIDCSLRGYAPSATAFQPDDLRLHGGRLFSAGALDGAVAKRPPGFVQRCRRRDQTDEHRADALSTASAARQPSSDACGAAAGGPNG